MKIYYKNFFLQIEWFLNGKPLVTGSRVKTICDFGFVILEITPVYPEDAGEYVCKASNSLGEAVTKAYMSCDSKESIISTSQLPDQMSGAYKKIRDIEAPKPDRPLPPDAVFGPPRFISKLTDMPDLVEGQLAHFEAQLEPATDPNLKVEWFHNGKPIFHSKSIFIDH